MADFTGKKIKDTYKRLIQLNGTGQVELSGTPSTGVLLTDGAGNASPLSLSQSRMGLGTATPSEILHVYSGSAASNIRVDSPDPGIYIIDNNAASAGAGNFRISTDGGEDSNNGAFIVEDVNSSLVSQGKPLIIQTGADTNSLYIQADNKVGIGTATPSKALDVVGDIGTSGDVYLAQTKSIIFDSSDTKIYADAETNENLHILADGTIEFQSTIHDGYVVFNGTGIKLDRGAVGNLIDSTSGYVDWSYSALATADDKGIRFKTTGSPASDDTTLCLTNDGKVGIGIANATSTLHVNNDGGEASVSIDGNSGTDSCLYFDEEHVNKFKIYNNASIDKLQIWNYAVGRPSITVAETGNVGINCQGTPYKLTVFEESPATLCAVQITNATAGPSATDGVILGIDADTKGFINVLEDKDFYIKTNDTLAMTVTNAGNVGLGIAAPTSKLHLWESSSGASAPANANSLVVEKSAEPGISLLTASTSTARFNVGSNIDSDWGGLEFHMNTNKIFLRGNGQSVLGWDLTDGFCLDNRTSPDASCNSNSTLTLRDDTSRDVDIVFLDTDNRKSDITMKDGNLEIFSGSRGFSTSQKLKLSVCDAENALEIHSGGKIICGDTDAPDWDFNITKSAGSSIGLFRRGTGAVVSGNTFGTIYFGSHRSDVGQFWEGASISATADSQWDGVTSDRPGGLMFKTAKDGTASLQSHFYMDNVGHVTITGDGVSALTSKASTVDNIRAVSTTGGTLALHRDGAVTADSLLGGISFDSTDGALPASGKLGHSAGYIACLGVETHDSNNQGTYMVLGVADKGRDESQISRPALTIYGQQDGGNDHNVRVGFGLSGFPTAVVDALDTDNFGSEYLPNQIIDLGHGYAGRGICWGGTGAGLDTTATIATLDNNGDVLIATNIAADWMNNDTGRTNYGRTDPYAVAGMRIGQLEGDIVFFTKASEAHTRGTQYDATAVANAMSDARLIVLNSGDIKVPKFIGANGTVSSENGVLSSASDGRYKNVDGTLENGLELVNKLNPVYYYWKEDSPVPSDDRQLGFIAQEVGDVIPEASRPSYTDSGEEMPRNYHDRSIIAALTKAVQELSARVESLENN